MMQLMYENMRVRVETVVKSGIISHDYINSKQELEAFSRWTDGFTSQNHPAVIQVLLECGQDEDVMGHTMPNLVYVSRGKSIKLPHNFKAGALNALLRVSATMTNAPVILPLDSDMYSNDPQTPLRALCYILDPSMDPKLAYVQFPQIFYGINKNDIYGGEARHGMLIHPAGMDGLKGPMYLGTGGFFQRKVFFGGPLETSELTQDHIVSKSIKSREILASAHHVADCNFESQTQWGTKVGFRYGSLAEDFYTSYMLQSYGQDYLELIISGGTTQRWWNNQRAWMMRGLSSYSIGSVEYILKSIGISTFQFSVTSKAVGEEQSKRYKKGMFEFGVVSPLFLPLTTAAIINLVSFLWAIAQVFGQGSIEGLLLQILLVGFAMVNCGPYMKPWC
ncbi:Cellulose synthase-like protein G1 [Vitis vinifera]|uniref:Cellulose synthase-like protein G1 n=1 Tax=Vitis vinifera TaxID=29760 RepID=A0A438J5D6_VITVI|nr:Cellulose synthase-like protein G1 [Vitis vinifera]